jgi:hypothetical protein
MIENFTPDYQNLLVDLSEAEQESLISGKGFDIFGKTDFFLQNTNIESSADNELHLGENESSSQNSKYQLSQITIGASFTFGLKNISSDGNIWSTFLPNILNRLFY